MPLLPLFANSKSSMVNQYLYSVANGFKKFVEADTKEETELRRYFETLSSENFKRLGVLPKDGETAEDELSRPFVLSAALYAKMRMRSKKRMICSLRQRIICLRFQQEFDLTF